MHSGCEQCKKVQTVHVELRHGWMVMQVEVRENFTIILLFAFIILLLCGGKDEIFMKAELESLKI
jgi:hypothetical protein